MSDKIKGKVPPHSPLNFSSQKLFYLFVADKILLTLTITKVWKNYVNTFGF
jgi:hypothetical protein